MYVSTAVHPWASPGAAEVCETGVVSNLVLLPYGSAQAQHIAITWRRIRGLHLLRVPSAHSALSLAPRILERESLLLAKLTKRCSSA